MDMKCPTCDEQHVDKVYEMEKCTSCDELQAIFDLQYTRIKEASKLWQIENNKPDIQPDLGKLIEWLMEKAGLSINYDDK